MFHNLTSQFFTGTYSTRTYVSGLKNRLRRIEEDLDLEKLDFRLYIDLSNLIHQVLSLSGCIEHADHY